MWKNSHKFGLRFILSFMVLPKTYKYMSLVLLLGCLQYKFYLIPSSGDRREKSDELPNAQPIGHWKNDQIYDPRFIEKEVKLSVVIFCNV